MPFAFDVMGATITISARLRFNPSAETIKQGRKPDCSRPTVGLKSAVQISPREGLRTGDQFPVFRPNFVGVESVRERARQRIALRRLFLQRCRVAS